jgi:hypothetical protein
MFEQNIQKLKDLIESYQADSQIENEIRQFFLHNFRNFLPDEVFIPTYWHVDDIRDYFTKDIKEKDLIQVLDDIFDDGDSFVGAGWEIIAYNIHDAAERNGVSHLFIQDSK